LREYKNEESKFRFIILASQRAKQLLKGAKPKIKTKNKNLIRVAQEEVERGLIDYRVLQQEIEEQESAPKEEAVSAGSADTSGEEKQEESESEEPESEEPEKS